MLKEIVLIICFVLSVFHPLLVRAEQIRVGLVQKQTTVELSCDDDFEVIDGNNVKIVPKGKYFLHAVSNKIVLDKDNIFHSGMTVRARKGNLLPKVNKKSYQGSLKINLDKNLLTVINNIDLEKYLASVLPAKSMIVWPDEVIKAQAVAARSYALYCKFVNFKNEYDLLATDKELFYAGFGSHITKNEITKLINATEGQYLLDKRGKPVMALSTSSSGGLTETAENFLGENIDYLVSVKDYDNDSPEYRWEYSIDVELLQRLLEQSGYKIGLINSIYLSPYSSMGDDRTTTGRVKYIIFAGVQGQIKISGLELADLLGLNSNSFDVEVGFPSLESLKVPLENRYGFEIGSKDIDIDLKENSKPVWKNILPNYHMLSGLKNEKVIFFGKGKGSGLGLSAWGARGLVNRDSGITYQDVLLYYYPQTELVYR